ncbi:hypothetical protein TNCV_4432101 [Trichonephila clavipes]|nr:hypothetical protein TNCV_4432101 [Trichonephila clavipes]
MMKIHDEAVEFFCAPVPDSLHTAYGWFIDRTYGSDSIAAMMTKSQTIGVFPMDPFQGIVVLRRSDYTNGL